MKKLITAMLLSLVAVCSGCAVSAQYDESSSQETNVTTVYGTVQSVSDGNVVISYKSKESSSSVTESVPDSVMVLKDSSSLHTSDLKANDSISVSYTNGKMRVIQVLNEDATSSSTEKANTK